MNRCFVFFIALSATYLAAFVQSASADIASALANATIREEFLFDDPNGTLLTAAANNVTSHLWDEDADTVPVTTNGLGQLNASLKNNVEFGTNYVDNDTITAGPNRRVLGVMEMTWDFDPNTLDTAENEELRISLIQFEPRSTFVVAEWEIQREDDNTLTILGNGVGTGATDLGPVVLNGGSLTQSQKFIAVVDAHMGDSTYEVHFSSDAGASFTTLGGGLLDPTRDTVDSLRMTLNNDLSGDNVLIDRVYLATIPEPSSMILAALGIAGLLTTRRHG